MRWLKAVFGWALVLLLSASAVGADDDGHDLGTDCR